MLTRDQFERTRTLALQLAGIQLLDRHRELLNRRSRRLGIRDSAGVDALLCAAENGETHATRQLFALLTTKFTGFFRHPRHFQIAADHALQASRRRGRACLWSAGAATGEEPYSLAMALLEAFPCDDPPASILATDLDVEALQTAQQGEYGDAALDALGEGRRARFFRETGSVQRWSIAAAVRRLVAFRPLNLADAAWAVEGPLDVIFCRNVLMYLDTRHRCAVLERMASRLAPDGVLMLDPAEHLGQAGHLFTHGADGVHSLRSATGTSNDAMLSRAEPKPTRGVDV